MKFIAALLLCLSVISLALCSSPNEDLKQSYMPEEYLKDPEFLKNYFKIEDVETTQFRVNEKLAKIVDRVNQKSVSKQVIFSDSESEAIDVGTIINLASKAWEFIKENKPVLDYKKFYGNALPKGIESTFDLHSWANPKSVGYQTVYKNGFGMEVVKFTYHLVFQYNGTYGDNNVGRYLDAIHFTPTTIDVMWGYTFNAEVTLPSIVNAGSSKNPVAQAMIELDYQISTPLKTSKNSDSFTVRGDGYVAKLN
ncbi:hypothetical protein ABK040_004648 [Willaertia magna]